MQGASDSASMLENFDLEGGSEARWVRAGNGKGKGKGKENALVRNSGLSVAFTPASPVHSSPLQSTPVHSSPVHSNPLQSDQVPSIQLPVAHVKTTVLVLRAVGFTLSTTDQITKRPTD